jgi:hypothetical protein
MTQAPLIRLERHHKSKLLDYGLFSVRFSPSATELVRGRESSKRVQ